jgi:hypothetical protein
VLGVGCVVGCDIAVILVVSLTVTVIVGAIAWVYVYDRGPEVLGDEPSPQLIL